MTGLIYKAEHIRGVVIASPPTTNINNNINFYFRNQNLTLW